MTLFEFERRSEDEKAEQDDEVTHWRPTAAWCALAIGLSFLLFLHSAVFAQTPERRIYDFGTATPDKLAHPLGVTIAALIKLKLLPQAGIDLNARNTPGFQENVLRLHSGDLDFAIVSQAEAYAAAQGTGPFADDGPASTLRHLTHLWTSAYHFIVRRADAPTGTFADFLELEGRQIALGDDRSPHREHVRSLFQAFGVDVEDAYRLADLGGADAAEAFLAGDLDGFLLVDRRQGADLAAFLENAGDGAIVLSLDADEMQTVERASAQIWARIVTPADVFSGDGNDQVTVGIPHLLATREQIPDDDVYRITRTIFDNLLFLQDMYPATAEISLETALDQLVLPVHAGAARYYGEVGVEVPEPQTARISALSGAPFLTRFDSAAEARTRLSDGAVTVLGVPAGHTGTRMISELAAALDGTDIRVVGMTTAEPAENIAQVLYARGVDSALVPLDVLDYALEQNVYPDIRGRIVYATELHTEEVHLLATDAVQELGDLMDRTVNLGQRGSASAMTASFLLDRLNISVEATYHDQQTALAMLQRGDLAALFLISGKPMPLLAQLPAGSALRLIELPPIEGDAYRPATLTASEYPNLIATNEPVGTFGVRTALLSYGWRSDNQRYRILSRFIGAFFDRLPTLQDPARGYHPKWREIDLSREVDGWRRSPAAASWIADQVRPEERRPSGADG